MEILIIVVLVLILLSQRQLRVRNTPRRGSLEWEVRYATRCVLAIVLASVATALWLS